jgi:hypothetical protein
MTAEPQFLTVPAAARKYSPAGFTIGSLRWQLFNRKQNGLDRAVVRIGRRLLLDEVEFVAWLRSQREGKVA